LIAGCAVNTGVVPAGQNTYMVARQAATGFFWLWQLNGRSGHQMSHVDAHGVRQD
jgi:hypothetical protein